MDISLTPLNQYPCIASSPRISRGAAAEFLGVAQSQITIDCGYLGYEARSPLSPSDLFGIYAIRQWQQSLERQGRDRRIIARRILSANCRASMLRRLEDRGLGVRYFLEALEGWLQGTSPALSLALPESEGLLRYKRIRQYRAIAQPDIKRHASPSRISRRRAAKALGVSHPTVTRYLTAGKALGIPISDRKSLGLEEFRAVWAVGKAISLCRQQFKQYRHLSVDAFCQMLSGGGGRISLAKTAYQQALNSHEADSLFYQAIAG